MKNRTPSIVPNQNITYLKPNPEINMVANLIIYFSSKTGLITQRLINTPRKVLINNLELLKLFFNCALTLYQKRSLGYQHPICCLPYMRFSAKHHPSL